MQGAHYAGVTLQTLDYESFDQGTILAQTPIPGLKIDLQKKPRLSDLLGLVTPLGADMLADGIRNRIFVPPLGELALPAPPQDLTHAPKITSKDKEIDWLNWDAATVGRRYRALGPLWNMVIVVGAKRLRIKLDGVEEVERPGAFEQATESSRGPGDDRKDVMPMLKSMVCETPTGERLSLSYVTDGDGIIIAVKDMAVSISHITIEGMERRAASLAVETLEGGKL